VTDAGVRAGTALRLGADSANIGAAVRSMQAVGVAEFARGPPRRRRRDLDRGTHQTRKHHTGLMDEASLLATCPAPDSTVSTMRTPVRRSMRRCWSRVARVPRCSSAWRKLVRARVFRRRPPARRTWWNPARPWSSVRPWPHRPVPRPTPPSSPRNAPAWTPTGLPCLVPRPATTSLVPRGHARRLRAELSSG